MELDLTKLLNQDELDTIYKIIDNDATELIPDDDKETKPPNAGFNKNKTEHCADNSDSDVKSIDMDFDYLEVEEHDPEANEGNHLRPAVVRQILKLRPIHGLKCCCPPEFRRQLHRVYRQRNSFSPSLSVVDPWIKAKIDEEDELLRVHPDPEKQFQCRFRRLTEFGDDDNITKLMKPCECCPDSPPRWSKSHASSNRKKAGKRLKKHRKGP